MTATEQEKSWAQDAVDGPGQLGRKGYPVRAAAPGTYVHDR